MTDLVVTAVILYSILESCAGDCLIEAAEPIPKIAVVNHCLVTSVSHCCSLLFHFFSLSRLWVENPSGSSPTCRLPGSPQELVVLADSTQLIEKFLAFLVPIKQAK